MSKDMIGDGGLAFPGKRTKRWVGEDDNYHTEEWEHSGMPLRDWFAGKAILTAGFLVNEGHFDKPLDVGPVAIAQTAYQVADAMLAERKKEKP